jgi:hypothetical protein
MEYLGTTLFFAGALGIAAALVWSFFAVGRENPVLAIICLFIPMGLPVALALKWPRTWRPLAAWLLSLAVFFCGLAMRNPGD